MSVDTVDISVVPHRHNKRNDVFYLARLQVYKEV
jgi:hypothetical protein